MAGKSSDRRRRRKGARHRRATPTARVTTGARRRAAAPEGGDVAGRVIAAALELAAAEGWENVCLADVAAKARLSPARAFLAFPSKTAIVDGFFARVDEQVLAGGEGEAGDSSRDRLFDVLMRRFDALQPDKAAVASILWAGLADPLAGLTALPRFLRSMAWMLEAAGLSSAGLAGIARTEALALIYANALRVWLRDDTPDMAKTMAALDRGLAGAESLIALCRRLRGGAGAGGKTAAG